MAGTVIYISFCLYCLFVSVLTFCRLAMSGETLIRGDPKEVCRRVRGWDSNSLYSFSMSQEMPTGVCQTRTAPDFVRKAPSTKGGNYSKVSLEWLDFEAHKWGVTIFNASNGPEVKISAGPVTLHGFEQTSCTAFLFQGCFWHACECQEGRDKDGRSSAKRARIEEMFGTSMEDIRRRDAMMRDNLVGYFQKVSVMKECVWNAVKKDTTSAEYAFINSRRPSRLGNFKGMQKVQRTNRPFCLRSEMGGSSGWPWWTWRPQMGWKSTSMTFHRSSNMPRSVCKTPPSTWSSTARTTTSPGWNGSRWYPATTGVRSWSSHHCFFGTCSRA